MELASFLAAPFGTALLADLGARVIKVEPVGGDPLRRLSLAPLPELYSARVMQGKESIAIDIARAEGHEIVLRLSAKADVVLQSFRGGVANKLGLSPEDLQPANPNLIYHYGQGYGVDGPYAKRPAYAPVIGAASGFFYRNVPSLPEGPELNLDKVKHWAVRMTMVSSGISVDHLAGLGVSVAVALGLLARARGAGGQVTSTSMLSTAAHVLSDSVVDYAGQPEVPVVDEEYLGFGSLYRLYQTLEGWVVLCLTTQQEWSSLASTAEFEKLSLATDVRFSSHELRRRYDAELGDILSAHFMTRSASEWERILTSRDVACVEVVREPPHVAMDRGGLADQMGMVASVTHPLFEEHTRTNALVSLSRSGSRITGGCLAGEHTDSILTELGYSPDEIARLRLEQVVA